MKKFGFYKNLNMRNFCSQQKNSKENFQDNNTSKIYAYKLFLEKHEEIIKKINSKKNGEM